MNRNKKISLALAVLLTLGAVSGCSNVTSEPQSESELSADLSQPQTTSTESTSAVTTSVEEYDYAPIIGEYEPNGAYDELIKQKEAELLSTSEESAPKRKHKSLLMKALWIRLGLNMALPCR